MHSYTLNGEPLPFGHFTDADGRQHHQDALLSSTDEELAQWGVARLPPTLEQLKAAKRAAAAAEYAALLANGFPCTLGGQSETLQLRGDTDRTNWLTVLGEAEEAVAAGDGLTLYPLPIRTTANRNHPLTNADAITLMRALRTWARQSQARFWDITAAIDAAPDAGALAAVDTNSGYPAP